MYVYKSMVGSRVTNAHHIINSALTGLRSPAGPRRLIAAIAALAFIIYMLFRPYKEATKLSTKV